MCPIRNLSQLEYMCLSTNKDSFRCDCFYTIRLYHFTVLCTHCVEWPYLPLRRIYSTTPSHPELLGCRGELHRHTETSATEVCYKLLKTPPAGIQGNTAV